MKAISPSKVLLIYKNSAYKIYFLERKSSWFNKQKSFSDQEITRFKIAHKAHYKTLEFIEEVLRKKRIKYHKLARGQKIDAAAYDFVITVGGDGTFLEAARALKTQMIFGVNSDPVRSVGRFCGADRRTFAQKLDKICSGDFEIKLLPRILLNLELKLAKKEHRGIHVLNDLLICHRNPAAISRYSLIINGKKEEQRSSGLWIATAAGSSGAIKSAGGKVIPQESEMIQYRPRELCDGMGCGYRYRGGILSLDRPFVVQSLLRNGVIYIDGAHLSYSFVFGSKAVLKRSAFPLNMVSVS